MCGGKPVTSSVDRTIRGKIWAAVRCCVQRVRRVRVDEAQPLRLEPMYRRSTRPRHWGRAMSILAWVVLGIVAGFIASKIVNKSGEGLIRDLVLGVIGAIAGGWIMERFGGAGVSGLNVYSLVVAILGAIVVLVVFHAIRRAV